MPKPNLVYIFADQLRFSSLGYNGDKYARTPNIDRFSAHCTDMSTAVSGHPVCAPYRASLLTGKYTTKTGMVINEIRINGNHRTFADVLNENGYEPSYIGKWHMYAAKLGDHFNAENSFIPPGRDRLGFDGNFAAYNFHHLYYSPDAYYHLDTPEKLYYDGYEPDAQTDMAINELRRLGKGDKPFALFLSLGTPHDPWSADNVPSEYLKMFEDVDFPLPPNYKKHNDRHADMWARFKPFERRRLNDMKRVYYAMVANLDANLGKLLKEIEASDYADNTIVVFTADHGEMFGAQGRHAKNIFYDESIRVPFLMKWGNRLPEGKNPTCLNTVDIMPTLLNLMKLPVPDGIDGADISENILSGSTGENTALLMGTGPTAIWGNGFEWRGIRTRKWTYAVYKKDGEELLFDNEKDSYQTTNLFHDSSYNSVVQALKKEMYSKMDAAGDKFRKNSYYKKHWVKNRIINEHLEP